jgi:hypothetical protein
MHPGYPKVAWPAKEPRRYDCFLLSKQEKELKEAEERMRLQAQLAYDRAEKREKHREQCIQARLRQRKLTRRPKKVRRKAF